VDGVSAACWFIAQVQTERNGLMAQSNCLLDVLSSLMAFNVAGQVNNIRLLIILSALES
jgi:hypothetical protein